MWGKRVSGMLMLGAVLAGCGRAPALSTLPVAGSQIASRQVATPQSRSLVITQATTKQTMANPGPGFRTVFTVGGTDGGTPFTLVVDTYNPSHLFVSKLTGVTLNGEPLRDTAARQEWSNRLLQAIDASPQALKLSISQASNYVRLPFWSGK